MVNLEHTPNLATRLTLTAGLGDHIQAPLHGTTAPEPFRRFVQ